MSIIAEGSTGQQRYREYFHHHREFYWTTLLRTLTHPLRGHGRLAQARPPDTRTAMDGQRVSGMTRTEGFAQQKGSDSLTNQFLSLGSLNSTESVSWQWETHSQKLGSREGIHKETEQREQLEGNAYHLRCRTSA